MFLPTASTRRFFLPKARAAGFSLTELLVVVVVIGILSSLLLPALAKAKEKTHRIKCVNNLRQLETIWMIYSSDYEDRIVLNALGLGVPTWVGGSFESIPSDSSNVVLLTDPRRSLFGPYLKTTSIYKCPSDKLLSNNNGGPTRARSYGMNVYVGWWGPPYRSIPDTNAFRVFRKVSEMVYPSPANQLVFQETFPKSICRPFFGLYMDRGPDTRIYHYPASYHEKSGVNSFADGHVEGKRWVDPRTLKPASANFHNHNERSPGNRDIAWIQERSTSPR